jgi:RNA polymerase sigma-70 factor, ECF subfamily
MPSDPVKDSGNIPDSTRDHRPEMTSPTLVAGVRRGDADAWDRLARLYGPLVYAWCRRAGLQAADAEDVLQEVFVTVSARVGEFRHGGEGDTFRGWLWAITRYKIGDWLKRRPRQAVGTGGSEALDHLHQMPEPDLPEAEPVGPSGLHQRALELVRGEFIDATWQAFWGVVVQGRDPADVATELGLSRNAVYIARSRVLRRLREALGE